MGNHSVVASSLVTDPEVSHRSLSGQSSIHLRIAGKLSVSTLWSLHVSERKLLLLFIDVALLAASVIATTSFVEAYAIGRGESSPLRESVGWLGVLLLVYPPLAFACDLYVLRVTGSLREVFQGMVKVWIGLGIVGFLADVLGPAHLLSRRAMILSLPLSFPLVLVWRCAYMKFLVATQHLRTRALVLGAGWAGREVVDAIKEHAPAAYDVVAFVDDDEAKEGSVINGVSVVGRSDSLNRLIDRMGICEVILAITNGIRDETFSALLACSAEGVRITPMPLLYEQLTGRVAIQHIGQHWYFALPLQFNSNRRLYNFLKRIFDIGVALLGLIATGLLLPLIALIIYADSPGPIFYRQRRVGKNGCGFELWKFRSMIPNAENGKAVWSSESDDRITRVGRFMRRIRIDELPQFWNVLRGNMSIIGPRPERPEFTAELDKQIPFYNVRHLIKPGLTGWAQVEYRYGNSVDDALHKLQYDLYYLRHQSPWLDLIIGLKTIGVILGCRGT